MAELERNFQVESGGEEGLDMEQFIKVFSKVLFADVDKEESNKTEKPPQETMTDVPPASPRSPRISKSKQIEDSRNRNLRYLFMKIDANSDGTVDWEEFTNFLLLENQGLESTNFDQSKDMLVRQDMNYESFSAHHHNAISSILYLNENSHKYNKINSIASEDSLASPKYNRSNTSNVKSKLNFQRYVTGSFDGTVKIWDANTFIVKKTIRNSPNNCWIMGVSYLPNNDKIAVVSMDGVVNLYDSQSCKLASQIMNQPYVLDERYGDTKKFKKEEKKWVIDSTPVCSSATQVAPNKDLLCIGTESGKVWLYTIGKDFHICSGDQSLAPNQISIKMKMNKWKYNSNTGYDKMGKMGGISSNQTEMVANDSNIGYDDIGSINRENELYIPILPCTHVQPHRTHVTCSFLDVHNDWITKLEYYDDNLQCLVTCSLDTQVRFTDIEKRKKSRVYMGHTRGVHSFAYCPEYKFMASCGVERKIHIFDTHRCTRLSMLVGHSKSVSNVLINEARHQIISLSLDKVVKIWDTRTFRCLQTIHDSDVALKGSSKQNGSHGGMQNENNGNAANSSGPVTSGSRSNVYVQSGNIDACTPKLVQFVFVLMFICLYSVTSNLDKRINVMLFDNDHKRLITATTRLQAWPIKFQTKKKTKSHDESCSAVLFNRNFEQAVSADFDGNIKVWDIETSEGVFRYSQPERVTALAFDTSQRRIITGTDTGALKIWNFSSGQCLCECRDHNIKIAHWREEESMTDQNNVDGDTDTMNANSGKAARIRGTEITGIVYVMEVSSWTAQEVHQWFESFRDKQLKSIPTLRQLGAELLDLTHESLRSQYKINDESLRRKILNAVSNLFQSSVASRYIVSVGWDNKIRVWVDSTNKSIQTPITVMPKSDTECQMSNQSEILCITDIPPVYVATGGSDGSICLWNVVSGHFRRKMYYPIGYIQSTAKPLDGSQDSEIEIECNQVLWLTKHKLILSGHSNGTLVLWDANNSQNCVGVRRTPHRKTSGICAMVLAQSESLLITADPLGYIQTWSINLDTEKPNDTNSNTNSNAKKTEEKIDQNQNIRPNSSSIISAKNQIKMAAKIASAATKYSFDFHLRDVFKPQFAWQGHHSTITGIDYLQTKDLLVTCAYDGEVLLWKCDGRLVGMFGQMKVEGGNDPVPKLWNLNDSKTWSEQNIKPITLDDSDPTKKAKVSNAINKHIAALNANSKTQIERKKIKNVADAVAVAANAAAQAEAMLAESKETLQLISGHKDEDNNDTPFTPEVLAILERPSGAVSKFLKKSKLPNVSSVKVKKQLQTFKLDEIPKESPF